MKEVVLVNQSTGFLMIDIANAFAEKYDRVTLITGEINVLERPLNSKIKCSRIIKYNKKSAYKRLYSWVWGTIQILWKLAFKYRNGKIFFVTNPPLSYLIAPLFKRDYSILIYDTYPDALKNIGISESNLFYKLWSIQNKKVFSKAHKIFTLSEGMATNLSKYVNLDKITIIENWNGSDKIKPIPKEENIFIKTHKLEDQFIILYSGTMGYTHNLEVLIKASVKLKNEKGITFLFIGDGKKKSELLKIKEKEKLNNCIFLDWQSADMLPFSLAAADLGVVTLNAEAAQLSVPSKTYNLMAAGVALLSISPNNSELSTLIDKYENGRNFSESEIDEICDFIILCKNNRDVLRKYSENSYNASKKYTYKNADLYVD